MSLQEIVASPFFSNVLTITIPVLIVVVRFERRLTILETEHRLRTKDAKTCRPS